MTEPRIAIVGTGANGASIGADLTLAGRDVTFIEQWPAHVEAMRANGLRIEMPAEVITTPVRALHLCEVATLREDFDVVLLSVKAYDTRWACELIRPRVAADGVVVGVQNGMTTDDVTAIVGAERSIGAVIENAANMFTPGVVVRQTPPEGAWFAVGSPDGSASPDKVELAASALRTSGTVEVTDDILSAKWMKLVGNAAEFLPTAILDLPMVAGLAVPGIRDIGIAAGREALDTALALGHKIVPLFGMPGLEDHGPDTYVEAVLDAIFSGWALEDTRVAVLQDWMKGRRGEGEDINGVVVEQQARLGNDAPVNRVLLDLSRRIERGELRPGPGNAEMLVSMVRDAAGLEVV